MAGESREQGLVGISSLVDHSVLPLVSVDAIEGDLVRHEGVTSAFNTAMVGRLIECLGIEYPRDLFDAISDADSYTEGSHA